MSKFNKNKFFMKNNDKNFDEIPVEKPSKKIIIPKVNLKSKCEYENIFLCPLNKHDVVNSIDILDDVIIYGTIMGNVYLCRVDKNNLIPKQKKKNIKDLNIYDINKEIKSKNINDDSSKISCIKLDQNSNNNKSINNNNNIYKINLNENKKEKNKNKNFYDSDVVPTTRSIHNKFLNHELNTKRLFLNKINKDIVENKISQSDQSIYNNKNQNSIISQSNNSNNSNISRNLNPLPQVVQLVTNASENIPCLSFDTKDKINVAVGDSDIIRFENLTNFNFENENESYYYTQIKNYKSENEHIRYCEGAICLMSKNNFFILFAPMIDYGSSIHYFRYSYINKNITTYEVIEGEIEIYNFIVPFDFDGNRFLYLEYESEDIRRISIYHTLTKLDAFKFKLTKDFGHISFMKFISYYKIIICKQNNVCEIRDVNDRFKLVTTWRHIGEEIIAMNVYIRGTKEEDEDDKFENSLTDLSYQKYNKERNGDIEYIDTNYKRNKKNKSKNKLSLNENIYGNGLNAKIHLKKFIKDDKVNNSTFRDLIGLNLKNHIKSNEEKNNEIAIYNSNKVSSGKENLTNEVNNLNKKNIDLLTNNNEYNYILSHKEFIERKKKFDYNINQQLDPTEKGIDGDPYIITVDKNGNLNKYHKGIIKTVFNLYNIKNIEQNYKDEEFFSLGFPYYVVMNNKYYAISTDHGIFVLSKKE